MTTTPGDSLGAGHIVGVFRVRQPAPAPVEQLGRHLVGALPLGPDLVAVFHHNILHNLWGLVGHNSNGEFPDDLQCPHNHSSSHFVGIILKTHLPGNDGFGSGVREGSLDPVKGEGGIAPPGHQGLDLVIAVHQ